MYMCILIIKRCNLLHMHTLLFCITFRFHDPTEEMELNGDVIPYLDDNIQLTIEEYRDRLYEV